MPYVRWSSEALQDLTHLLDFLEEAGSSAGTRASTLLLKDAQMLARFPMMGRNVPGLPAEFREIIVPFGRNAYVLRYRVQADEIVITNLRHSREAGYQRQ